MPFLKSIGQQYVNPRWHPKSKKKITNNQMCTFLVIGYRNCKNLSSSTHPYTSKYFFYLRNCARKEVAMRERFLLILPGIGMCVDVHTIKPLAKNV